MSDKTPLPGNNPCYLRIYCDMTPEGVRARIAAFCKTFDVAPCKVTSRKGQVYLTEELRNWMLTNGASCDWICAGDPMVMVARYREDCLRNRNVEKTNRLDPEEQKMLADALAAWTAAVYARRERINAEQVEATSGQ